MSGKRDRAKTKHELILEMWRQLECGSVGAPELQLIQEGLLKSFGEGAVDSPASIARTLADEGARLRHPEVLDCDTLWRERQSFQLFRPDELSFSTLKEGAESIEKIEALREQFEQAGDDRGIELLRALALKLKRDLLALSRSQAVEQQKRLEAREIADWLTVWLQDARIFRDWLSLRLRSSDFLEKHGE